MEQPISARELFAIIGELEVTTRKLREEIAKLKAPVIGEEKPS